MTKEKILGIIAVVIFILTIGISFIPILNVWSKIGIFLIGSTISFILLLLWLKKQ